MFACTTLCWRERATMILSLFICASQVGILSTWLDRSSWFLAQNLPSTSPILCSQEIRVTAKLGHFSLKLLSTKLWTYKNVVTPRSPSQMLPTLFFCDDRRKFIILSVHFCLQHDGRDAAHCAGPFAAAETRLSRGLLIARCPLHYVAWFPFYPFPCLLPPKKVSPALPPNRFHR